MHPHDTEWVKQQIMMLPKHELKEKAYNGYSKAYKAAMDSEPVEHKKENKARREANTRLRLYVSKFL